jgi:hypothetical protein
VTEHRNNVVPFRTGPRCDCDWELPTHLTLHALPQPAEADMRSVLILVSCPRCSPNAAGKMVRYTMQMERTPDGWWQWTHKKA